MSNFRIKRGSAVQNNSYVGPSGELTFDTTNKILRVHDGATSGGIKVPGLDANNLIPNTFADDKDY